MRTNLLLARAQARTQTDTRTHTGTSTTAVGTVVVVVAMMLVLAACRPSDESTTVTQPIGTVSRANSDLVVSAVKPAVGGKLVYGLNAESNGWNPGTNQWGPAGLQVARTVFDTLAAFDDTSQIHPYLAQRFEPNADYTTWTIHLRPDVTLHNGRRADAEVVRRNQVYFRSSPVTKSAYAIVESITADGNDKVVFTMSQPWAAFPMAMATQIGVVADPDWLESNDGLEPIGTGPFSFDSWTIGNNLTVRKNGSYWQTDSHGGRYPYLDSVEFRVIVDGSSRAAALRAGDIDIMEAATAREIIDFQGETDAAGEYQVFSSAKGETAENFVMLNTKVAPFDDPEARRALAHATDKDAYVDTVAMGLFEPANGPWAPDSPWFGESGHPQFDQVKARELVEQVKARHGGRFSFTVNGSSEPGTQLSLQVLQQQWAAVGIEVEIALFEQATMIINVVSGNYQAVSWQQFDSPHPSLDSVWWSSRGALAPPAFSLNFARNDDPEIERALNHALASTDPEQVKQDMLVVQRRLAIDVPYVWLYHSQVAIVASMRVTNFVNYTLPDGASGLDLVQGSHPLHQVWLA